MSKCLTDSSHNIVDTKAGDPWRLCQCKAEDENDDEDDSQDVHGELRMNAPSSLR